MRRWYKSLIKLRKQWHETGLLHNDHYSAKSDPRTGLFVMRYANAKSTAIVAVRITAETDDDSPCPLKCRGDLILDSRDAASQLDALLPNHARIYFNGGNA